MAKDGSFSSKSRAARVRDCGEHGVCVQEQGLANCRCDYGYEGAGDTRRPAGSETDGGVDGGMADGGEL